MCSSSSCNIGQQVIGCNATNDRVCATCSVGTYQATASI
jgi:hypothetical protein